MSFDKGALLSRRRLPPERIEVRDAVWHFRPASAGRRVLLADNLQARKEGDAIPPSAHMDFVARVIVASACDEEGAFILSESDIPALLEEYTEPEIAALGAFAMKVNGIGKKEDAAGPNADSGGDPSAGSPSG